MYPYGAYTEKTEQYISNLGFQGSLAAIDGVRTFKSLKDLKAIPRLTINNEQKGEKLIEMIESNDEVLESQAIEAIIEEENLEALEVLEIDVEKDE
jgi:Fe-S cluster assembly iron-binding protein IscA